MQDATDHAGELCRAVSVLERAGLIDYNGHVSLRLPDGRIAINSGASNRASMTPADITLMNGDGETELGFPAVPKERTLHTELYRARSDVGAIVHAHSISATMLSTCLTAYAPVFPQGALVGAVPLFADVASINTPELGAVLARTVGGGRAGLLQSHGLVTCGATLTEAVVLALYLEENARRQMLALSAGGRIRVMTPEEVEAAEANLWDAKLFEKAYAYFSAKAGLNAQSTATR